jgi:glycerophosphoryl diester phosphodiesterase
VLRNIAIALAILIGAVLIYYSVQAALRIPARTAVQVAAHRGGAKYAPENTLAAFRNAISLGGTALEFDVQMTKDGELVVIHDATVDRTTNGTGAILDLTLAEIRSLDAGNGEKVPTLSEVVQLAKAAGATILPEAKSAHLYPGIEEKMLGVIEAADYLDHTTIQSFEPASLDAFHRLNPKARLCALYGMGQFDLGSPHGEAQYVCPMAEMILLDPGMIRQAHSQGRIVNVWFLALENPFVMRLMRFYGADGFIVNDPVLAKETFHLP